MNNSSTYGLPPKIIEKIQRVFSNHKNVEKACLYGSRATGNYHNGSGIDLTLYGQNLTLSELFQIDNELDDLLMPYKIDLSLFAQIENQDLIQHISRVGKCFYLRP